MKRIRLLRRKVPSLRIVINNYHVTTTLSPNSTFSRPQRQPTPLIAHPSGVQKGLFSARNRLQTVKALFGGLHVYTKGVPLMPPNRTRRAVVNCWGFPASPPFNVPSGLVRIGRVAMGWCWRETEELLPEIRAKKPLLISVLVISLVEKMLSHD
ncbi:hypothetical protein NPIL_485111 [Nephila pilipes]|uniref:Uncharacterized protein n=1 Tax=Nephila pilipes TaxID=299642 RepID=A0A8X6U2J1_NEPPI|nr:hypothetical protein NPIL_485111 [Nephila pilipes]